jgi:hypothetical protein
MLLIFSTPMLIRHLLQLDTVVFLHRCLICATILRLGEHSCHRFCKIHRSTIVKKNSVALKLSSLKILLVNVIEKPLSFKTSPQANISDKLSLWVRIHNTSFSS